MKKYFSNFDWLLFGAFLALLILGLFTLASVSPGLFPQQGLYALLGLVLFFLFSQIDYRIFEKLTFFLYLGSIVFLLSPLIFGTLTRGAVRWVQIGGLTVQPSEIVKPILVLFFAWFFGQSRITLRRFLIGGLLLVLPVFLIFWQPALGTSLVVIFSWWGMVVGADIAWRFLALTVTPFIIGLPLIWRFLKDYQRQRIFSFLNPLSDPLGAGYHLIQAKVAVGSGQLLGRGFGRGTQSQLRFLPERQTDFIFASFAEEMGFLGSLILILGFLVLFWRILTVARQTEDLFGYLICVGVFSMLFFQAFINMGMNLGLLPITGVTLPLISHGGSSLMATMVSLGLVESVARLSKKRKSLEIR